MYHESNLCTKLNFTNETKRNETPSMHDSTHFNHLLQPHFFFTKNYGSIPFLTTSMTAYIL